MRAGSTSGMPPGRSTSSPTTSASKAPRCLAFAGLWEVWAMGEMAVESCTIITTAANALMKPIHDRMPVILPPADYAHWLDPEATDAEQLLRPFPADAMTAYHVST